MSLRSYKPLRSKSWLRTKARPDERKVSWRTGAVKETAAGIHNLRREAFRRSNGICECHLVATKRDGTPWEPCGKRVTWNEGHLHHNSDERTEVLAAMAFIREQCHADITGKPQWRKR